MYAICLCHQYRVAFNGRVKDGSNCVNLRIKAQRGELFINTCSNIVEYLTRSLYVFLHGSRTHSYLLQLAVSWKVTAHEHMCFLPLQYSEGEQQSYEGVILTGINDQLVSHLSLCHVPILLLGTILQTVFQHLKNATTLQLVCARLNLWGRKQTTCTF